ncbi:Integrase (XerC) [uncultured Mediterranean phage uvMED]|nr:Integrase (XerC) [uncultured Mediterranean phage uvMED]
MQTHKTVVHGKIKYVAAVETGDFYPTGRPILKRFYHARRNEAVAKANEFLKNKGTKKDVPYGSNGYTINDAYLKLESDWDVRVADNEDDADTGFTEKSAIRLKDNARALFKILGNPGYKTLSKQELISAMEKGKALSMSQIDSSWYETFIKNLKKTESKSKAKNVRNIFRNILEKAEELDWIISPHHKYKKSKVLQIHYKPKDVRSMTIKEALRLNQELEYAFSYGHNSNQHGNLNAINGEGKTSQSAFLMMLQYPTGIRWGEAAALTTKDFDWVNLTLRINKSRDYRTRKVSKTKAGKLRQEDAMQGERIVPLPKQLKKYYDRYIKDRNIKSGYLFDVSYERTLAVLQSKCEIAKIPEEIVDTKMFRRFIVSQWQKQGVDPKTIALRIGHNDTLTQNGYGTFSDPKAKADMGNLAATIY